MDAMACAVRAAWAALSAATSGGTVDHEALAYQGVETALREPYKPGPAHDVPNQEPVILAHWPGPVVVRAHEAAQREVIVRATTMAGTPVSLGLAT